MPNPRTHTLSHSPVFETQVVQWRGQSWSLTQRCSDFSWRLQATGQVPRINTTWPRSEEGNQSSPAGCTEGGKHPHTSHPAHRRGEAGGADPLAGWELRGRRICQPGRPSPTAGRGLVSLKTPTHMSPTPGTASIWTSATRRALLPLFLHLTILPGLAAAVGSLP